MDRWADTQRRYRIYVYRCNIVPLRRPFIIVRRRLTNDRLDRFGYYSTIVRAYSDLSRPRDELRTRKGNVRMRRVKIVSLEIARVLAAKSTSIPMTTWVTSRVLYAFRSWLTLDKYFNPPIYRRHHWPLSDRLFRNIKYIISNLVTRGATW